jgi:hypothetical protein
VGFHNAEFGHGPVAQRTAEFHERMGTALLAALTELLGRVDILAGRQLIYVAEVECLDPGNWWVERYALHGEVAQRLESLQVPTAGAARLPRSGRLYLQASADAATRELHPLVTYDAETARTFFLNASRGAAGAEYVCYTTGEIMPHGDMVRELQGWPGMVPGGPVVAADAWAESIHGAVPPRAPSAPQLDRLPSSTGAAPAADENVQFTVYRPRAVLPEQWYPLLAFAHLTNKRPGAGPDEPDPVKEVQR